MNPKLSILVCTMPSRAYMWSELMKELLKQRSDYQIGEVQILTDDRMNITVGAKRNYLLKKAKGEYLCFHDDDDWPSQNYVDLLMDAIRSDCDCASLKGEYSVDGKFDGIFEHSLKYKKWETVTGEIKYLRTINHLNLVRSSIAKQISYPEKNFGEDHAWSKLLHESGLLKTEYYIPEILYYYNFKSKK